MQTSNLFLFGLVPVIFLLLLPQVLQSYDESDWQPVQYDYYHIDLGELTGNQDQEVQNPRFEIKTPIPRDAIVNVVNDLGIKLLSIHNERNENNIAISPYGAFSVLAALSEGVQGDAAHEILHAARIPHDKQMIRVGLRDLHRHLKSYFIPEEGFLAGLTLNLNNVSLKSSYEDVLRFYGFDYSSFNNALYPDPPTTKKSVEGTGLETGLSVPETTTGATPESRGMSTTTEVPTKATEPTTTTTEKAIPEETTPVVTTTPPSPPTTTTVAVTSPPTIETTTIELEEPSNEATETPTVPSTTEISTETETVETSELDESGEKYSTTSKKFADGTGTSVTAITKSVTENGVTTTKSLKTTANFHVVSGSDGAASEISETILPATTEGMKTIMINTVRTTRQIQSTTNEPSTLSTTNAPTTVSTTSEPTTLSTTTQEATTTRTITTEQSVSTTFLDVSTSPSQEIISTTSEEAIITEETDAVTIVTSEPSTTATGEKIPTSTEFIDLASETFSTTTESRNQDNEPTTSDNFEINYNYDISNVYDENMLVDVPNEGTATRRRRSRSVVDYVIARSLDSRQRFTPPPRTKYLGVNPEPPSFAVYGKYREPGVNFMNYDTVLPYHFVANLNALALSFPLDSTKYYLLLLLPLRDDGVDQLICDLRMFGNLRYIIDNLRLTHVVATIPSFMLKGFVTLTPTLQRLGVRKIFEPRQADFTPMTNASNIYVTNIEQAVTVTIRNYLDPSAQLYKNFQQFPPVQFKADHPFLYFVVDAEQHVALMVGKVINPLNSRIG